MSIYFDVNVHAGTSIEAACKEAVELAVRLRVPLYFDFNGVLMRAAPDSNAERLAASYQDAIKGGRTFA